MTVDPHLEADIAWLLRLKADIESFPMANLRTTAAEVNARIDRLARAKGGEGEWQKRAEAAEMELAKGILAPASPVGAREELEAVQAIWADIQQPGGTQRLIQRASDVKEQLRRVADNGYTRGRSEEICEAAAFIISQLTTALASPAPEGWRE